MRQIPSARFDELDEEFHNASEDFVAMALEQVAEAHRRAGIARYRM